MRLSSEAAKASQLGKLSLRSADPVAGVPSSVLSAPCAQCKAAAFSAKQPLCSCSLRSGD